KTFEREGGARLREHAVFEALHRHWCATPGQWSWRDWPPGWRDRDDPAARRFADEQASEVRYHIFLQWLADRAFRSVHDAARAAGMRIGLISDMAVGMSPSGSHAWSRHEDLLLDL